MQTSARAVAARKRKPRHVAGPKSGRQRTLRKRLAELEQIDGGADHGRDFAGIDLQRDGVPSRP